MFPFASESGFLMTAAAEWDLTAVSNRLLPVIFGAPPSCGRLHLHVICKSSGFAGHLSDEENWQFGLGLRPIRTYFISI